MELKITVDVGIRRLGRRSEAAANNQPTFMAGGAARERACDEECRAPLPNADFGSGGMERNRQLCQNSNEPQTLFSFRRWRTGRSLGKARLRPQNEITKPLLRTRECVPGPKRNDDDSKRID